MTIGLRIKSVFKIALLEFKTSPRENLSIALYLAWGLWAALAIPRFGSILTSIIFISAYNFVVTKESNLDRGLVGFIKFLLKASSWKTMPLILLIIPSIILLGTAQAMAFTPSEMPSLIFLGSFTIGWLTIIYLSIVLQGVALYSSGKYPLFQAADIAMKLGLKNWRYILYFSFYVAIMFVIALLPIALGLIAALPLYLLMLKENSKLIK